MKIINETYDTLFESAPPSVQKNLEILKQACELQVKFKNYDFSIATIGRTSKELGGVSTQTIRNKSNWGEKYREIISLYHASYGPQNKVQLRTQSTLTLANSIEDAATRIQVLDLLAENRKLKRELDIIRNFKVIDINHGNASLGDHTGNQASDLTDVELSAISNFISETHLKDLGWEVDKRGRLVDASTMKSKSQPFFFNALQKVSSRLTE